MKWKITALILSTILLFGFKGINNQYCNGRFQFCITYPNKFKGQGESANGDGQVFLSRDGKTEIRAYGNLVIDEQNTLTGDYKAILKDANNAYKLKTANSFIVSYKDSNGNIFYRKTVEKMIDYMGLGNTKVLQSWTIRYPESQSDIYKPYCELIAKRLK